MFARTERLLLRPGWAEDAPALAHAFHEESLEHPRGVVAAAVSNEALSAYLHAQRDASLPDLLIFTRTAAAPLLIGSISLHRNGSGDIEFDAWISKSHRRQGFAYEAGRAMQDIACQALALKQLTAVTSEGDPAAQGWLEKLGFVQGGRIARYHRASGKMLPAVRYNCALAFHSLPQPSLAA